MSALASIRKEVLLMAVSDCYRVNGLTCSAIDSSKIFVLSDSENCGFFYIFIDITLRILALFIGTTN